MGERLIPLIGTYVLYCQHSRIEVRLILMKIPENDDI